MRRVLLLSIILVSLLSAPVYAEYCPQSAQEVIETFMAENGLTEQNFSISYYNTVTGEAYAFNDEKFSIAASTYKLPLNMYFYEMERDGMISGDTIIGGTGKTLDEIHEMSIVHSNNEVSEVLMYYWGDHTTYKNHMRKYFSMTEEEIDPLYYQGNFYCVRMMMDTLRYLYENRDQFSELLEYMRMAAPDAYFKLGVKEFPVAHKYGEVQWFMNDTAIIYTPQPFLLAVYTQNVCNQEILGEVAARLAAYTCAQTEEMPEQAVQTDLSEELDVTVMEKEQLPETAASETKEKKLPEAVLWETEDKEREASEKPVLREPIREDDAENSGTVLRLNAVCLIFGIALPAAVFVVWIRKRKSG